MAVQVVSTLRLSTTIEDTDRESVIADMRSVEADMGADRMTSDEIVDDLREILKDPDDKVSAQLVLEVIGDGPTVTTTIQLRRAG